MQKDYNDKGNQNTREEFFVAMFYLLECCDSEKNASHGKEFVKYAKDNFGLNVDRRRANPIFSSLFNLTNKKNKSVAFPFIVKEKKLKKGVRYYVEKRLFTDNDILTMLNSISKDSAISNGKTIELQNKLLEISCTNAQRLNIEAKQQKRFNNSPKKLEDDYYKLYDYINMCADNNYILHFKLKDIVSSKISYPKHINREDLQINLIGYVAKVINIQNKQPKVCIYLHALKERNAIITPIDNIKITKEHTESWNNKIIYKLDNCKYETVYAWLDEYYQGKDRPQYNITFKFYAGENDEKIGLVKKSMKEWFKLNDIQHSIQYREVEFESFKNGKTVKDTIHAKDAVINVSSNFESFKKWYFESGFYDCIVVLSPKEFNDMLLISLVDRFVKRINKYGERYDLKLEKHLKPDYRKQLEERFKKYFNQKEKK